MSQRKIEILCRAPRCEYKAAKILIDDLDRTVPKGGDRHRDRRTFRDFMKEQCTLMGRCERWASREQIRCRSWRQKGVPTGESLHACLDERGEGGQEGLNLFCCSVEGSDDRISQQVQREKCTGVGLDGDHLITEAGDRE